MAVIDRTTMYYVLSATEKYPQKRLKGKFYVTYSLLQFKKKTAKTYLHW